MGRKISFMNMSHMKCLLQQSILTRTSTYPKMTLPFADLVWRSPDTRSYCTMSLTKYPRLKLPSPYSSVYKQDTLALQSDTGPPLISTQNC